MSATGQYMVSAGENNGGNTCRISRDYGATFTVFASASYTMAISATGQYLTYAPTSSALSASSIYISSDYGTTFRVADSTSATYSVVAMSGSGQYQFVSAGSSLNKVSADYGVTWLSVSLAGVSASAGITGCAISGTGQYMTAVQSNVGLWTSANYGTTWTFNSQASINALDFRGVAMSQSGQFQVATVQSGRIWASTNYGQTWSITTAASGQWVQVAMSSSGDYIFACNNGTGAQFSRTPLATGTTTTEIALGYGAGLSNQSSFAVALGAYAGQTNQSNNTIVINASGSALNTTTASSFYINPIRQATNPNGGPVGSLWWNSGTSEVCRN